MSWASDAAKNTFVSKAGNVVCINHSVHPKDQNILGGMSAHEIVIQLPANIKSGNRFEIVVAADKRPDAPTKDDAVSTLQSFEATVFRFYEPEIDPITDGEFDSLGWIKILSINQKEVTLQFELIDAATMREWDHYGIPRELKLPRLNIENVVFDVF